MLTKSSEVKPCPLLVQGPLNKKKSELQELKELALSILDAESSSSGVQRKERKAELKQKKKIKTSTKKQGSPKKRDDKFKRKLRELLEHHNPDPSLKPPQETSQNKLCADTSKPSKCNQPAAGFEKIGEVYFKTSLLEEEFKFYNSSCSQRE
ncbi:unnamed protein product [Moneuplotes crassus]|uniref:Uncharacterized protein n=1 Tax=Euplotes crassus TaxID=5936 RepID=A0AAD2D2B1_EUPCR|nr:unnamed protein product [Moneuplotes crassus]